MNRLSFVRSVLFFPSYMKSQSLLQKCLSDFNSAQRLSVFNKTASTFFSMHRAFSTVDDVKDVESDESQSPAKYVVSHEDFKWVKRLLPPSVIPDPPKHSKYPTPSGWSPPSETVPDLPYYIPRTRYHLFPIFVETSSYRRTLTSVKYVEGDIWELEKALVELIRPLLKYDPATRVHEVTRTVTIKGDHEKVITDFLISQGF